ncbi:mitochondrial 39-S ribosomal protein L47 (MRP-L47)-domain-containing protein [Irpex rosettiformis]|uniref:Mitochondrial 39-S ribosomal protein L47 (MRP-L47)-domain-containing protein n=1 Tax=Irpex rosettiformis TaxID=378272 RepID=A0ACB8TWR0_9APHY|nr:mitochondrial 39-S ribosomal protein L47 (MRP-L47)-domain-containing protein [Irpex rosettiformis]
MPPSISFTRLGLSGLRSSLHRSATTSQQIRAFASVLPDASAAASTSTSSVSKKNSKLPGKVADSRQPGALRPHLGVEIDPNHGLWGFFRKQTEDGVTKVETVEPLDHAIVQSGRSWTAAELRRKSFKDLHTLWYVLLRERNLLATQREEARRAGISYNRIASATKVFSVRKSMARIKYVLNERRLAYEGAVDIHQSAAQELRSEKELRSQKHKAAIAKAKELKEQEEKQLAQEQAEPTDEATKLAVAGVLQSESVAQNAQQS